MGYNCKLVDRETVLSIEYRAKKEKEKKRKEIQEIKGDRQLFCNKK